MADTSTTTEVGSVLGGIALLVTIGNGVWGWISGMNKRAAAEAAEAKSLEGVTAVLGDVAKKLAAVESDLSQHKVDVARFYVRSEALQNMETRLLAAVSEIGQAVGRLGERIDRNIDRGSPKAAE